MGHAMPIKQRGNGYTSGAKKEPSVQAPDECSERMSSGQGASLQDRIHRCPTGIKYRCNIKEAEEKMFMIGSTGAPPVQLTGLLGGLSEGPTSKSEP